MLSKYFLSHKTSSSIKARKQSAGTTAFDNAVSIGLLYTYSNERNFGRVNKLITQLEKTGKTVDSLIYIVKMGENDDYPFSFCNSKDLDFWGNWNKPEVTDFINKPFDYLLNLDLRVNDITQNILAKSKAKCRVGRFEEGKSDYFELMIDQKEDKYGEYIDQVYHYIKNVRNGK